MRDHLRTVRFRPYRKGMGPTFTLETFHVGRYDDHFGRERLAYILKQHENGKTKVLFEGDDFGCSPMHSIDGDKAIASLMGFLTLKPGDTDEEYFERYTPEQMEFCQAHGEALEMEVMHRFGES
jgi:hypothetical protein